MGSNRAEGGAFIQVDVRADGFTIEGFEDDRSEQPDHVVERRCQTDDLDWLKETAIAEAERLAVAKGWTGAVVNVAFDPELILGGDPAPASPSA